MWCMMYDVSLIRSILCRNLENSVNYSRLYHKKELGYVIGGEKQMNLHENDGFFKSLGVGVTKRQRVPKIDYIISCGVRFLDHFFLERKWGNLQSTMVRIQSRCLSTKRIMSKWIYEMLFLQLTPLVSEGVCTKQLSIIIETYME